MPPGWVMAWFLRRWFLRKKEITRLRAYREETMTNFMMNCARLLVLLIPAVGLATPAPAAGPDPRLADTSQPGSVIVFPKFVTGTVVVDGVTTPKTEIEMAVLCRVTESNECICPPGEVPSPPLTPFVCAPPCPTIVCQAGLKVRFHWVCPGSDDITFKYICPSNDFDVVLPVNGKAVFNPENLPVNGSVRHVVPKPAFNADGTLCTKGYLIGYVIDTSDRPIKFDGLIGDAVLRVSGTAVQAYRAVTLQADTALATGALITLGADGGLIFDGGAGHYKTITGQISGDVKYDNPGPPTTISTSMNLLTLDVRQGLSNYPTNVHLNFWSEDEIIESTQLHFVCYGSFNLSTKIDPNLTAAGMGTRKGIFQSSQAIKTAIGGIADTAGPVTLLALVHTAEGPTAGDTMARSYIFNTFNNGVAIPTEFLPGF
jgi:hypothetical protein